MSLCTILEYGNKYWLIFSSDSIVVCYDKPKQLLKRTSGAEMISLFRRLEKECRSIRMNYYFKHRNLPKLRSTHRPYIAVCASSWSIDEDMQTLFDALKIFDGTDVSCRLHVFITGKRPLRNKFIRELDKFPFRKVRVFALWLKYADYQRLLGSADFGISLHRSASGLDLPMKIVDYFSCELPVFSVRYEW